jgi:hypothetical protein
MEKYAKTESIEKNNNSYFLNYIKENKHFEVHYSEFDKTCINKVSIVLENSYIRITNNYNQQLQEKLIIEIHPDLNQLRYIKA